MHVYWFGFGSRVRWARPKLNLVQLDVIQNTDTSKPVVKFLCCRKPLLLSLFLFIVQMSQEAVTGCNIFVHCKSPFGFKGVAKVFISEEIRNLCMTCELIFGAKKVNIYPSGPSLLLVIWENIGVVQTLNVCATQMHASASASSSKACLVRLFCPTFTQTEENKEHQWG